MLPFLYALPVPLSVRLRGDKVEALAAMALTYVHAPSRELAPILSFQMSRSLIARAS